MMLTIMEGGIQRMVTIKKTLNTTFSLMNSTACVCVCVCVCVCGGERSKSVRLKQ